MKTKEQILIDLVTPDLPIMAYAQRQLLPRIKATFPNEKITLETKLEIHSMVDLGVEGGIGCELRIKGMDPAEAKAAMLVSITHLKIKKGEPHYQELQKYCVKRIRKLKRQDRRFL